MKYNQKVPRGFSTVISTGIYNLLIRLAFLILSEAQPSDLWQRTFPCQDHTMLLFVWNLPELDVVIVIVHLPISRCFYVFEVAHSQEKNVLKIIFLNVYVCVRAHAHTWVQIPVEARRECPVCWGWSYKWLWAAWHWCWEPTQALWKAVCAVNCLAISPSPNTYICYSYKIL